MCSKNTVTMLCSNVADGNITCTSTYITELTIFMHEFNLWNGKLQEEEDNYCNTI
jgi:hypothetical protein